MTDVGHVVTRLNSLFKPGFASEDRVLMDAKGEMPMPGVLPEAPPVKVRNGPVGVKFRNTASSYSTTFHSAFDEPDLPAEASERQSCEYRVGIFFLDQ